MALFGPAVPLAAAGWQQAGEPLHAAGLAVACVLALVVVPLVMLALLIAPSALLAGLVPRRWRIAYRHAHEGRPSIPRRLRRAVYAADRYRCVYCGIKQDRQVDHFRPWASGGLTSLFNLFTLCGKHNRVKSNYWKDRDGYVHYRAFKDADNAALAALILAAEKRARLNPVRWLRAAWAL